jgi:hypothetical protein
MSWEVRLNPGLFSFNNDFFAILVCRSRAAKEVSFSRVGLPDRVGGGGWNRLNVTTKQVAGAATW